MSPARAALAAAILFALPPVHVMGETARSTITVAATIGARTSLKLSSDTVRLGAGAAGQRAVGSVTFSAAARTRADGEVLLTVERIDDTSAGELNFASTAEGSAEGAFVHGKPAVAGRWVGSGHRRGTVTLSGSVSNEPTVDVPLRFLLTAP